MTHRSERYKVDFEKEAGRLADAGLVPGDEPMQTRALRALQSRIEEGRARAYDLVALFLLAAERPEAHASFTDFLRTQSLPSEEKQSPFWQLPECFFSCTEPEFRFAAFPALLEIQRQLLRMADPVSDAKDWNLSDAAAELARKIGAERLLPEVRRLKDEAARGRQKDLRFWSV